MSGLTKGETREEGCFAKTDEETTNAEPNTTIYLLVITLQRC